MSRLDLGQLLDGAEIVLCGGTGGVGKTTTAAALGVLAARRGRRTLVVTVDPARRLAGAMGLAEISSTPAAVEAVPGLAAMMLDAGRTFDELVERYAPDAATRDAILANPYYQQITATIAGSREFMAMEKVYALAEAGDYDLLVVDTPPSRHALDFLEAPRRVLELLDGSGLSVLLRGANFANRLSLGMMRRSQDQLLRWFETLTGHRVVGEVSAFFTSFAEIFDDFRGRSRRIEALMRAEKTRFLVISAADPELLGEASAFAARLRADDMHLAGMVVNRMPALPPVLAKPLSPADFPGLDGETAERVSAALATLRERATHAQTVLRDHAPADLPLATVPRIGAEVASLAMLERIAEVLAAGSG